jgi:uncharacterized Zn finger protein (UPF0148 family)
MKLEEIQKFMTKRVCKICGVRIPFTGTGHTYCKVHIKDRGRVRIRKTIKH